MTDSSAHRKRLVARTFAILALATGFEAVADDLPALATFKKVEAEGRASYLLEIENDSLLFTGYDRYYTSGIHVAKLARLMESDTQTTIGWRLGQDLYTASDIKLPPSQVGPPDHPYAGWLYGGVSYGTDRSDGTSHVIGLDLGCFGACAGGHWTQDTLHKILRQPLPVAWSTQMKNELGAVLYGDYVPIRWNLRNDMDLAPDLHGRIGNIFTDAGAGLTFRFGQLSKIPGHNGSNGFIHLDVRAVGYNASLQGALFSSGNTNTVTPKRMVGDIEAGWRWTLDHYDFLASVYRRSTEISAQSNATGAQNIAKLQFTYTP